MMQNRMNQHRMVQRPMVRLLVIAIVAQIANVVGIFINFDCTSELNLIFLMVLL